MTPDPIWAAPEPDAPPLQHEAHSYLMVLLPAAESALPDVISRPRSLQANDIIKHVLAASLNHTAEQSIRSAMVATLVKRLQVLQPSTSTKALLPASDEGNALSKQFGLRESVLNNFMARLERFIVALPPLLPVATLRCESAQEGDTSGPDRSPDVYLGLLVALLVLRSGQTCLAVLDLVLQKLGERVWVAGPWAWLDVTQNAGRATAQLRRIFLDPLTLGAFVRAASVAGQFPAQSSRSDARPRKLAHRSFSALVTALNNAEGEEQHVTLAELCHAKSDWLHINSVPMLATYARGHLTSSSLATDQWLRLINHRFPDPSSESANVLGDAPELLPQISNTSDAKDSTYQLNSGDMETDVGCLIVQLRQIMSRPQSEWADALVALRDANLSDPHHPTTSGLAVAWLHYLVTSHIETGSKLAPGTIVYLRGLLVNRLLTFLPAHIADLDAEQLTESYAEVIEDASSVQHKPRIAGALSQFDRYVRKHWLPELPVVRLQGFAEGERQVSALIISAEEYRSVIRMTGDGTIAYSDPTHPIQDRVFMALGYRLGLRRSEILGLRGRDVRMHGSSPVLLVRNNAWRTLKTRNGVRTLPLGVLTSDEQDDLRCLCESLSTDDFLYFRSAAPTLNDLRDHAVVPRVRLLLRRISGTGRVLHPHNLRHSFASDCTFGTLADDLSLVGSPYLEPWMQDSIESGRRFIVLVSGQLHRLGGRGSAIGMAAGHGSELTTCEHYVHLLDLLVFLACSSSSMMECAQGISDLVFRRGEAKLINAMQGFPTARGIESVGIPESNAAFARRFETFICIGEKIATRRATSSVASDAGSVLSIQDLLTEATDASVPGYPANQASRDTVVATLHILNSIDPKERGSALTVLRDWFGNQTAEIDWASFRPNQARDWLYRCAVAIPNANIKVIWDYFRPAERTYRRLSVEGLELVKALETGEGSFRVRLNDPRPNTGEKRKRTQRSVTWALGGALRLWEAVNPTQRDVQSNSAQLSLQGAR